MVSMTVVDRGRPDRPAFEFTLVPVPTPIARMRALVQSGALDRWQVAGDNATEITAALRLIPEVLAQLDAAVAELRKAV